MFTKITFKNVLKKAHFIYFIDNKQLGGRALDYFPFILFSMRLYGIVHNKQKKISLTGTERL